METIMTKKTLPRYWQSGGRICGAILGAAIAWGTTIGVARAQAVWAHQNGSLTPSGALVIKSLAGGSYNGTQNPTGALAKGSQAAATQPATVVIQATGNSSIFSYQTDCYTFDAMPSGANVIGAGKINADGSFTGIFGGQPGAKAFILSVLTGGLPAYSSSSSTSMIDCDRNTSCGQWSGGGTYGDGSIAVVRSYTVTNLKKCYP